MCFIMCQFSIYTPLLCCVLLYPTVCSCEGCVLLQHVILHACYKVNFESGLHGTLRLSVETSVHGNLLIMVTFNVSIQFVIHTI